RIGGGNYAARRLAGGSLNRIVAIAVPWWPEQREDLAVEHIERQRIQRRSPVAGHGPQTSGRIDRPRLRADARSADSAAALRTAADRVEMAGKASAPGPRSTRRRIVRLTTVAPESTCTVSLT